MGNKGHGEEAARETANDGERGRDGERRLERRAGVPRGWKNERSGKVFHE